MTANSGDRDLAARVRRLEARVADLSRVSTQGRSNLRDLLDVEAFNVQDGQGLVYDASIGRWRRSLTIRGEVIGAVGTQTFTSDAGPVTLALGTGGGYTGTLINVGLTWDGTNHRWVVPTGADGHYFGFARAFWSSQDDTGTRILHLVKNQGTGSETVLDDDHQLGNGNAWRLSSDRTEADTRSLTFTAAAAVTGSVTFTDAFAVAPTVELTDLDTANLDLVCSITAVSTTGFSYRAATRNGASVTASATLHWTATGIMSGSGGSFNWTNHVAWPFDLVAGDTVCCQIETELLNANGATSTTLTTTVSLPGCRMALTRIGPS